MSDDLKQCPFCGGKASKTPDPNHSTGWEVGCFSEKCDLEPYVWAVHLETAVMQWNTRADADRMEELECERNDLLSFDDYFRSRCGFKRDSRDSKECLDEFLAELKRQDVIVPFDHLLLVAKERNEAEAKLAKAMDVLREIAGSVPYADNPWHIALAALAEMEEIE